MAYRRASGTKRLHQIFASNNILNKAILSAALYDVYQNGEKLTQEQINIAFNLMDEMLTLLATEGDPNDIWPAVPLEHTGKVRELLFTLDFDQFIIVNTRLLMKHRSQVISLDDYKALVSEADKIQVTTLDHTLAALGARGEV